jgi:dimethylargininase
MVIWTITQHDAAGYYPWRVDADAGATGSIGDRDMKRTFLALTHRPSVELARCELTCIERQTIEYERALDQHDRYCQALREAGAEVKTLDINMSLPDSAFVEDCAVVLDEVVVLTTMGNTVRRQELPAIEREIARHRTVVRMELPGRLDGGDVLRIGRTFYVGLTARTDADGIDSFRRIVESYGHQVVPVEVRGCLHLKSACTALDDETILINPAWVDLEPLRQFRHVRLPDSEPWGANVLRLPTWLCMASAYPRTLDLVRAIGYEVRDLDVSEFSKAEAALTCMSLLLY